MYYISQKKFDIQPISLGYERDNFFVSDGYRKSA